MLVIAAAVNDQTDLAALLPPAGFPRPEFRCAEFRRHWGTGTLRGCAGRFPVSVPWSKSAARGRTRSWTVRHGFCDRADERLVFASSLSSCEMMPAGFDFGFGLLVAFGFCPPCVGTIAISSNHTRREKVWIT